MAVYNIYALIKDNVIQQVVVPSLSLDQSIYDMDRIAKCVYGEDAFATDVTQYPIWEGCKYINGKYYREDGTTEVAYIPTTEQKVNSLDSTVAVINQQLNPTIDTETCSLEELISYTVSQFGKACSDIIYSGSDVKTSLGTKHFSYKDDDQRNLKAASDLATQTGFDIPYHADGENCTLYTADDIINIYEANELLKTYQATYCNQMNQLIRAAKDKNTILNLSYGDSLPKENQDIVDEAVKQTKLVFSALKSKLTK